MKPFFTAFCALCLTAVYASAGEPELIERPLTWSIDSIQIVWNVEEEQTENYEWRSKSQDLNYTSTENVSRSQDTQAKMDVSLSNRSADANATVKGGIGFSPKFLLDWGLEGSASMNAGLGRKKENRSEQSATNEWISTGRKEAQITRTAEAVAENTTVSRNREFLFTVNFVNHTDEELVFAEDSLHTIPIFCAGEHIGDAKPLNRFFHIPPIKGQFYPCQFVMELSNSKKMQLLQAAPDIQILKSQIRIVNSKDENVFTQSIQDFSRFTVYLTADGAERTWEFKCDKKNKYTLHEVLEAINEDCEEDDLFEFDADGALVTVAGIPYQPGKDSEAFVLLAWNGKPVTELQDLEPRKNRVLDVILVSRALLETRQPDPLVTLVPFKETLEGWAKDGMFDGKNLTWNLLTDKEERLAEIKQLAEEGDAEMQFALGLFYAEKGENAGNGYEEKVRYWEWHEKSVEWCAKAASQGLIKAQIYLAKQPDCLNAQCYELGALEGDSNCAFKLGIYYLTCEIYDQGVKWLKTAVEKGNVAAMTELGLFYHNQKFGHQDYSEALKWFKKGAENEDGWSLTMLGFYYADGIAIEKNRNEAIKLWKQAVNNVPPNQLAASLLANAYYHADGVPQDYFEAFRLWKIAERRDDGIVYRMLGFCYYNGNGVGQDYTKAKEYFHRGAQKEDAAAMFLLGQCFMEGKGTEKNEEEGLTWIRIAAKRGLPNAIEYLQENNYSSSLFTEQ